MITVVVQVNDHDGTPVLTSRTQVNDLWRASDVLTQLGPILESEADIRAGAAAGEQD